MQIRNLVLAFILSFISLAKYTPDLFGAAGWGLFGTISVGSVFMIVALSLLELFVAFLQAYIFVFLTTLFIASAVAPEH